MAVIEPAETNVSGKRPADSSDGRVPLSVASVKAQGENTDAKGLWDFSASAWWATGQFLVSPVWQRLFPKRRLPVADTTPASGGTE